VLAIIVESAALYTIATAVLIGTYAGHSPNAARISFQINVQIVCIVPTLILVRAGLSPKTSGDWDATHPRAAADVLDWPIDRLPRSLAKNDDESGARV